MKYCSSTAGGIPNVLKIKLEEATHRCGCREREREIATEVWRQ